MMLHTPVTATRSPQCTQMLCIASSKARQHKTYGIVQPTHRTLRHVHPRATQGDDQKASEVAPSEPAPTQPPAPEKPTVVDAETAKAKRTAIVTGVISIVFGVAYLALVSFMDLRGGELLPPPPEAYGP